MIFITLIGNHDNITQEKSGGAILTIFRAYLKKISHVFLLVTPDTEKFNYYETAQKTKRIIQAEKSDIIVEIIPIKIINPIDFEYVYRVLFDESQKIIQLSDMRDKKKIINITSGTPTMTACWIMLQKSGLIPNAMLIQSFEPRYQREYGKTCQEVNLEIDNFPEITAPNEIKRELLRTKADLNELSVKKAIQDLDASIPALIGKSNAIREIKEQIIEEINTETHVLIIGEPGTGKEVVAKAIWNKYRSRIEKNMLVFDCGQFQPDLIISELFGYKKGAFTGAVQNKHGIVSRAHGRMLYLDEIGNFPVNNQGVFMRFMQFGEYKALGSSDLKTINVQIVAATNRNISDSTIFKPDLKDRFHEVIYIPPLRERRDDIVILADEFLKRSDSNITFGNSVYMEITRLSWPGNVRQLKMWIERLQRKYKNIKLEWADIPIRLKPSKNVVKTEDYYLPELPIDSSKYFELLRLHALEKSNNNMAEADRLLGLKPGTIKQWLHQRKKRQN